MWDKIARTGTFTDMNGRVYTFTRNDLQQIAENYSKRTELAPLVFGHPATDGPAHGWVKSLRVNGDTLEAEYEDIKPKAQEAIRNKEYRYKSIAIVPGTNTLRHVGLLGAVPPAMSGLGDMAFADEDESLTLFFSIKEGGNKMDKEALELLAKMQAEAKEKEKELEALKAKITELEAQTKTLTDEKTAAEKQTEEVKAEFAKFQDETRTKARTARVDALVESGRVTPSERDKVIAMASALGSTTANFASDSGQITAEEQYLKDLEGKEPAALFSSFTEPQKKDNPVAVSGSKMVTKL